MPASQTQLCQPESEDCLDALHILLRDLPVLPSTIRYYDDFDDRLRSIDGLEHAVNCELWVNGSKRIIHFNVVGEDAGSKLEKAKKLSTVHILTEQEFVQMVKYVLLLKP
jgi:hypothetical protein